MRAESSITQRDSFDGGHGSSTRYRRRDAVMAVLAGVLWAAQALIWTVGPKVQAADPPYQVTNRILFVLFWLAIAAAIFCSAAAIGGVLSRLYHSSRLRTAGRVGAMATYTESASAGAAAVLAGTGVAEAQLGCCSAERCGGSQLSAPPKSPSRVGALGEEIGLDCRREDSVDTLQCLGLEFDLERTLCLICSSRDATIRAVAGRFSRGTQFGRASARRRRQWAGVLHPLMDIVPQHRVHGHGPWHRLHPRDRPPSARERPDSCG